MGDALTTAIHRMKDRGGIQSLLGALSGWTLIIFGLLGLILFFGAEPIFQIFVASEIDEAVDAVADRTAPVFLFGESS